MLLDDPLWTSELRGVAAKLPKPKAILIVSAHWESEPVTLSSPDAATPLVYDFGGFDPKYYQMKYETPDAIDIPSEMTRMFDGSYFSSASAGFEVNEIFVPQLHREITERGHLDDAKRLLQSADRENMVYRSKLIFITYARRALHLMNDFKSEQNTKKAIHWSLNQMGHALAQIARNRPSSLEK